MTLVLLYAAKSTVHLA